MNNSPLLKYPEDVVERLIARNTALESRIAQLERERDEAFNAGVNASVDAVWLAEPRDGRVEIAEIGASFKRPIVQKKEEGQ